MFFSPNSVSLGLHFCKMNDCIDYCTFCGTFKAKYSVSGVKKHVQISPKQMNLNVETFYYIGCHTVHITTAKK